MKKSLIALAAFAAVGAASAQVTVYGKLDLGVSKTSGSKASVGLNGWETSRLGFKAEQKAGDLTLSIKLEGKLGGNGEDASFADGFNRVATIDVTGSFGSVTLGTQWTPYDNAIWTADAMEYNGFTPLKAVRGAWTYDGGNTGNGNAARSVQYTSPDLGGFQAIVLTAPVYQDKKYSGVGLNYSKGPLTINFATQSFSPINGGDKVTGNVLSAQYDMGVATLTGGVINAKDTGDYDNKEKGIIIGVKVPLGADSVSVGYSTNKTSIPGDSRTTKGFGVQYIKSLNKNAVAYFGALRSGKLDMDTGEVTNKTSTGAGIRYSF